MDEATQLVSPDWKLPKVMDGRVHDLIPEHDPRLRVPSQPYDFELESQEETDQLVLDLSATMRENRGIGLAAIQCGIAKQVFLMEIGDDLPLAIFNPIIVSTGPMVELDEGCLSFKGVTAKISRPQTIRARFRNLNNEVITYNFEGLSARVFGHEYDHLFGRTMRDYMSRMKWERLVSKCRKRR